MIRKLLTTILLFIFQWTLLFAALTTGINLTILNQNFWPRAIAQIDFTGPMGKEVSTVLIREIERNTGIRLPFNAAKTQELVASALTPEWLRDQLVPAIQNMVAYLDGSSSTITAAIDLKTPKSKLPPELRRAVPNVLQVANLLKPYEERMRESRGYVGWFKIIQQALVVIALALAAAIVLINIGHLDELARLLGASALWSGIPLALLGTAGIFGTAPLLTTYVYPKLAPVTITLIKQSVAPYLHQGFMYVLALGGALIAAAIILFLIARMLRHRTL